MEGPIIEGHVARIVKRVLKYISKDNVQILLKSISSYLQSCIVEDALLAH